MPQDKNAADAPGVTGTQEQTGTEPAQQTETPEIKTTANPKSVLEKLGVPVELHGEIGKGISPNAINDDDEEGEREQAPPIEDASHRDAATAEAEVPQKGTETEETKAEDEHDDEEHEDEKSEIEPPKDAKPGWERKRIGQLARQKRERDERIAELEAQLGEQAEDKETVFVDRGADPLAHITTPDALARIRTEARQLRKWCHIHPNGAVRDQGTDKEEVIPAEKVAEWLSEAEDLLDEHIPNKIIQFQQRAEAEKQRVIDDELARKKYPSVFDKRSQEYQIGKMLDRELPGLANHPSRNLVIGDYLRGAKERIEEEAKAKERNGNNVPKLPEALTRNQNGHIPPIAPETARVPSNSPAVPQARKLVADATKNVIAEGGTFESIKNLILAKRKANQNISNPRSAVAV